MKQEEQGCPRELHCPRCGGTSLGKARRQDYKHARLLVQRPLSCRECGWVFVAPSNPVACVLTVLVGVALCGGPALLWVGFGVRQIWTEGFSGEAAFRIVVGLLVIPVGLAIVRAGIVTAGYSRRYWRSSASCMGEEEKDAHAQVDSRQRGDERGDRSGQRRSP